MKRNNNQLYEAIIYDIAKIVKKRVDSLDEGFINSLLGTGKDVKFFINKIKLGIQTLNNKEPKTVYGALDPNKVVYDKKEKVIKYDGDADHQVGFKTFKGVKNVIIDTKVSSNLSEKEEKELIKLFGKTKLGQEIFKYSDEFKKLQDEKQKKLEKDPTYQGEQLANLVEQYFSLGIYTDTDKKRKEYIKAMSEIISKYRNKFDKKFDKAYAKEIETLSKQSSKLNSNLNHCETVDKLNKEIIGDFLNKH